MGNQLCIDRPVFTELITITEWAIETHLKCPDQSAADQALTTDQ